MIFKDDFRELKDAEHILNITFKNNRSLETINCFLNVIINFYDKVITLYLKKLEDDGVIEDVPKTPVKRAEFFLKYFKKDVAEFIEIYLDLRKCLRAPVVVTNEHRRNIEVVYKLKDKEVVVNPKVMKDILDRAKEFLNMVLEYLK